MVDALEQIPLKRALPPYTLLTGHVLELLPLLPAQSIHTVVTSPPYYGLRDYRIPGSVWGGDPAGRHRFGAPEKIVPGVLSKGSVPQTEARRRVCTACGAWFGPLGLEPSPAAYIAHLVQIGRELWRVLRDDGTLWLNLGDCYSTGGGGGFQRPGIPKFWLRAPTGGGERGHQWNSEYGPAETQPNRLPLDGYQPKDLLGMPWRTAIALQEDGWLLRRDIIWSKPNPMPESAGDRPVNAHEYLFLFAKSRRYYFDALAILEPMAGTAARNRNNSTSFGAAIRQLTSVRRSRDVWSIATEPYSGAHFATFPRELPARAIAAATSEHGCCADCGAPYQRIVLFERFHGDWSRDAELRRAGIKTANHPKCKQADTQARAAGAPHDSPFPAPETVGWQPSCGCGRPAGFSPADLEQFAQRNQSGQLVLSTRWERRQYAAQLAALPAGRRAELAELIPAERLERFSRPGRLGEPVPPDLLELWIETGVLERVAPPPAWEKRPTVPAVVLDPFAGSGTTLAVARSLGRRSVGLELNPEYAELAHQRIEQTKLKRQPRPAPAVRERQGSLFNDPEFAGVAGPASGGGLALRHSGD